LAGAPGYPGPIGPIQAHRRPEVDILKKKNMDRNNLPLLYGIFIGAVAIAFFLFLSLFGLHRNPMFSAANFVFFGLGQFLLIQRYKRRTPGVFKYQDGFWALLRCGIIATFIITGFFLVYITELNPGFLHEMLTTWEEDYELRPGVVIMGLALMGFSTSLVFSLIHMQLFKPTWNTAEGKKHTL